MCLQQLHFSVELACLYACMSNHAFRRSTYGKIAFVLSVFCLFFGLIRPGNRLKAGAISSYNYHELLDNIRFSQRFRRRQAMITMKNPSKSFGRHLKVLTI